MFTSDPRKRALMRYYKRRLYSGRTAAARAVDYLTVRLIVFAALFLWFSSSIDNIVLIVLLSLTALTALCVAAELVSSIRLERFIVKERKRLARRAFTQKLMMLDDASFFALVEKHTLAHPGEYPPECPVYPIRSIKEPDEDELVKICRSAKQFGADKAFVFSASEAEEKTLSSVSGYSGVKLSVVGPDRLMEDAGDLTPTEADIDTIILEGIREEKENRKKTVAEPFKASRVRRYILVGAGLFALSFFVDYSLYYRLLAGACVSFGALSWWVGAPAKGQADR